MIAQPYPHVGAEAVRLEPAQSLGHPCEKWAVGDEWREIPVATTATWSLLRREKLGEAAPLPPFSWCTVPAL